MDNTSSSYQPHVMLLYSSRLAFATVHELVMMRLVKLIVIPAHCSDELEQTQRVLQNSPVEIIPAKMEELQTVVLDAMKRHVIDVAFMISFSFKIPSALYQFPVKGFFNIHPGPLPAYRGPDPVFFMIRNREKRAGISIHVVDDGFDTGDIVMLEQIKLNPSDTYGKLTSKLSVLAAQCVQVVIRLLMMDKQITGKKQDESRAVYYPRQKPSDVCIDWQSMNAVEIVALINAGNPWNKGAVTLLNGAIIVRIVEACVGASAGNVAEPPGMVINVSNSGLDVVAINGEVLSIKILYTDDGFYSGSSLQSIGIRKGFLFSNIDPGIANY